MIAINVKKCYPTKGTHNFTYICFMKKFLIFVLLSISFLSAAQEANFEAVSFSVNKKGKGWSDPVPSSTLMHMDLENSLFLIDKDLYVVYGASTHVLEDGTDVIVLTCLDGSMKECEIWLNKFEGGGIGVFLFYPNITFGYTVIIVGDE